MSHTAIALCCGNFTRDRLAQFMGAKGSTWNAGVRQGDVISPILFNAGLEHAMRKWKAKLVHHGHGSRLTNIRYADDLLFFFFFFFFLGGGGHFLK